MSPPRVNEAADDLRKHLKDVGIPVRLLDAALAAERETYEDIVNAALAAERAAGAAQGLNVLKLSWAIDDHALAMADEPIHDGGTCTTDCAGDIAARYLKEPDR